MSRRNRVTRRQVRFTTPEVRRNRTSDISTTCRRNLHASSGNGSSGPKPDGKNRSKNMHRFKGRISFNYLNMSRGAFKIRVKNT